MKIIDIIIPTFEQEDFTIACLKSIRKNTTSNQYRIIWVDNGSTRESRLKVLAELKNHDFLTIWSDQRLGFVKAINLGVNASDAEFVLLQNNDTEVTKNWLKNLIYPLKRDPDIMISGPCTTALTSQQSWDLLKNKGGLWDKMPDLSLDIYKDDDAKSAILEKIWKRKYYDINMLAFFSVIIRKSLFDEIGVLSEDYLEGYFDDCDFAQRTKNAGYKLAYVPSVYVHHAHMQTFKKVFEDGEINQLFEINESVYTKKGFKHNKQMFNDVFTQKRCIINQPKGIGDIMYCQKIGYKYQALGYKVIWPIRKPYMWINKYLNNFEYPCVEDDFLHKEQFMSYTGQDILHIDEDIIVPLVTSEAGELKNKIMIAKYEMADCEWFDWRKSLTIYRDLKKETDLFYNKLGLKDKERYIFRSTNILHPPRTQSIKKIELSNDIKIIDMDFIDGFTLFDWIKVIEHAEEIHVIDSSISFIIEKFKIRAKRMCLYSRSGTEDTWDQTHMLFTNTPWEYKR